MADIEINTRVKADLTELQKIKKELKEMQSLALNGDGVAAKRVAELKDKLEDLNDATKSLKGSGVERVGASFGLLSESIRTADLDKFKIGLKGLGSAMAALPLFFMIEGIKLIIENWDKAVEVFKTVTGTFSNAELKIRSLNKELEKQKSINQTLIAGLENEIKILEAQGASSAKILQRKRELNAIKIKELEIDAQLQKARVQEIIDNDSLTEAYYRKSAAVLSSLGFEEKAAQILKQIDIEKKDRAKEAIDKFKADQIAIQNLKTEQRVEEIKFEKEQAIKINKIQEDRDKAAEDRRKKKREEEEWDAKQSEELSKKKIEIAEEENTALVTSALKAAKEFDEAQNQLEIDNKLRADRKLEIEKNYIAAAAGFSALFFDWQLRAAEGNEAKQLEIKKRAFQVEKVFRATQATIDTVSAIQKTLAQGGVLATPLAISMGVLGAANVAKILAQQFNPGSAPSASQGTPRINLSGGSGQNPAQQTIPTNPQQSSQFDENGKKINERPIVVKVSEINGVQRNVARVEEQSRF